MKAPLPGRVSERIRPARAPGPRFRACHVRAGCLALAVAGMPVAASAVPEPQEAGVARAQALRAARARDWAGALDSFGVYVEKLTLRHGRDRMLAGWILDEYVRTLPVRREGPDLESFAAVVDEKIRESGERPVLLWRLHLLKADMARLQGDRARYDDALAAAIQAYPDVAYPDPASHGYLHTLYNEAWIPAGAEDLARAEAAILQKFEEDRRFLYFDIGPWRDLHARIGNPARTADFAKKVLDVYAAKIAASPDLADTLIWYRLQLAEIHGAMLHDKLQRYRTR